MACDIPLAVLIDSKCHQDGYVLELTAPVAFEIDAIHIDIRIFPAAQRTIAPGLDTPKQIRFLEGINARCVLHGCFWDDDSSSIFRKTGQQIANSVSLYIPLRRELTGRRFVPAEEWAKMSYNELTECWTFNMRQLPLIVKGDNPFEFVQGTASAVTTQENQFLAENPSVRRAKDFNLQDFGSVALRHAVIRA